MFLNNKQNKIELNKPVSFKNELDLNIFAKQILGDKEDKELRLYVAKESLLRALIYYVHATNNNSNITLNEVLSIIEEIKKSEENKENFDHKINSLPVDHPARIYWREISSLSSEEFMKVLNDVKDKIE